MRFCIFAIIFINLFADVTSKGDGDDSLVRWKARIPRQANPICIQDPNNLPPEMPQCFCCVCAGISPFCRGTGPITTRATTTPRTTIRTTPRTPPPITVPCIDSNSNCRTWVSNGFCTNAGYTPAQRQQFCAKSCNLCGGNIQPANGPGPIPSTCADTSTSCSNWIKNGFCTSPNYTAAERRQYCGRSCNLC